MARVVGSVWRSSSMVERRFEEPRVPGSIPGSATYAVVAQWLEHSSDTRGVGGSNPPYRTVPVGKPIWSQAISWHPTLRTGTTLFSEKFASRTCEFMINHGPLV